MFFQFTAAATEAGENLVADIVEKSAGTIDGLIRIESVEGLITNRIHRICYDEGTELGAI